MLSCGKACPWLKGGAGRLFSGTDYIPSLYPMDSSSTVYPAVIQHLHTYVTFSSLKKLLSRLSSALLCMSGALWSSLTLGGGFTKLPFPFPFPDRLYRGTSASCLLISPADKEGGNTSTHTPELLKCFCTPQSVAKKFLFPPEEVMPSFLLAISLLLL